MQCGRGGRQPPAAAGHHPRSSGGRGGRHRPSPQSAHLGGGRPCRRRAGRGASLRSRAERKQAADTRAPSLSAPLFSAARAASCERFRSAVIARGCVERGARMRVERFVLGLMGLGLGSSVQSLLTGSCKRGGRRFALNARGGSHTKVGQSYVFVYCTYLVYNSPPPPASAPAVSTSPAAAAPYDPCCASAASASGCRSDR